MLALGPATGWAVASLAHPLAVIAASLASMPPEARRAVVAALARPPAYALAGFAAGLLAPEPQLHPRFWPQLASLAESAVPALAAAYALALLDPWARRLAGRGLREALGLGARG